MPVFTLHPVPLLPAVQGQGLPTPPGDQFRPGPRVALHAVCPDGRLAAATRAAGLGCSRAVPQVGASLRLLRALWELLVTRGCRDRLGEGSAGRLTYIWLFFITWMPF